MVMLVSATSAMASPITFASAADYDNATLQATGLFRDVLNGDRINRGQHLVGGAAVGAYTALNFTGSDSNTANAGMITVYDVDPSNATPTLFSGNISMSMDVLIDPFNNAKGAGLMTLFNEGVGLTGLSVFLWDAGNSDGLRINAVAQNGTTTGGSALASVALGTGIPEDQWFRLMLDLTFTSATNFTLTGQVWSHSTSTNPNSALGVQIGTTLTYNGVLSAALLNPYEIGIVSRGVSAVVDTSVTNFWASPFDAQPIPEPGTLALLATGVAAVAYRRRRKK
jgi:hypothetical protein